MAEQPDVFLGTVGFGLIANTDQLQKSLEQLTLFSDRVNRAVNSGSAMARQYTTVEKTLASMGVQVSSTSERLNKLGAEGQKAAQQLEATYGRLNQTMIASAKTLTNPEMNRAIIGMRSEIGAARSTVAELEAQFNKTGKATSALSTLMFDFNKATILAAGPLSGFGARVAVMGALLREGSIQSALFIAGVVGIGYAMVQLSIHAVKTAMEMQKFDALLTSASGSSALSGEEFQYVAGQAQKLGASVQGLVQPYAMFATAARLSGMSLSTQRDIFEGVMTASTALRLDTDQTGRAFLALEQMVSKGQVQMQELKLQFGQAIPGAMEIAAIAMGKTGKELNKMMAAGELLPGDLLPKLAKALKDMFGAGAVEGARTLQSEFNRLGNAAFFFNKALDDNLRISSAVRSVVIGLADSINFLTRHMNELVAVVGALTAGFAALAAVGIVGWVIRLLPSLAALRLAFAALSAGGVGGLLASITALIPGLGTVASILIRVAAAVGAGYFAYKEFSKQVQETTGNAVEFASKAKDWMDSVDAVGWAHKRTYDLMKTEGTRQVELLNMQILGTAALLEIELLREKHAAEPSRRAMVNRPLLSNAINQGGIARDPTSKSQKVMEIESEQAALQKALDLVATQMERINKVTNLKNFGQTSGADEANKAWESFLDTIRKTVESGDKWQIKLEAFSTLEKEEAERVTDIAEAFEKANDTIERLNNLKSPQLAQLRKLLEDAGFGADDLTTSLALMYESIQNAETEFKHLEDRLRKQEEIGRDFKTAALAEAKATQELTDRLRAARDVIAGVNPERLANEIAMEKHISAQLPLWQQTIKSVEGINKRIREEKALWADMSETERYAKSIVEIRQEVDRMQESWGSKGEKALKEYYMQLTIIDEAVKKIGMSQEKAELFRKRAADDLFRKQLENSSEWMKQFSKMIGDMEKNVASAMADWSLGGETSFKDMLSSMMKELLEFTYRALLLKPLFTSLFGDLATGGGTGDLGIIGKFFKSFLPSGFGVGGGGNAPVTTGVPSWVSQGHSGAIIGVGSASRLVSSGVFAGAPRLHMGGLLGDEVPFIGRKGEHVLTPEQFASHGSQQIVQNFNFSVQGSSDPHRDAMVWKSVLMPAAREAVRAELTTQLKPAGALNPV